MWPISYQDIKRENSDVIYLEGNFIVHSRVSNDIAGCADMIQEVNQGEARINTKQPKQPGDINVQSTRKKKESHKSLREDRLFRETVRETTYPRG